MTVSEEKENTKLREEEHMKIDIGIEPRVRYGFLARFKGQCPVCGIEWDQYYSMICPSCGKCYHWTEFGSDYRCSCGKKHYWYGTGWLDVDENGHTVFKIGG